jgi:hypothetical protein
MPLRNERNSGRTQCMQYYYTLQITTELYRQKNRLPFMLITPRTFLRSVHKATECTKQYTIEHKSQKNVLDLRFFVVIKLPEDCTLVSKHVGAGT